MTGKIWQKRRAERRYGPRRQTHQSDEVCGPPVLSGAHFTEMTAELDETSVALVFRVLFPGQDLFVAARISKGAAAACCAYTTIRKWNSGLPVWMLEQGASIVSGGVLGLRSRAGCHRSSGCCLTALTDEATQKR